MVLEHAILNVPVDRSQDFEAAFSRAQRFIAASPGFQKLTLSRCIEQDGRYLLLVEWDTLHDHEVGFRQSPAYQAWKDLLHHFYEPLPIVQHFTELLTTLPLQD
jgi:heme-degrading monooxygenase HmoA